MARPRPTRPESNGRSLAVRHRLGDGRHDACADAGHEQKYRNVIMVVATCPTLAHDPDCAIVPMTESGSKGGLGATGRPIGDGQQYALLSQAK